MRVADASKSSCYDARTFLDPPMDRAVAPANIFRFGLFEADATRGTLTRNGARVKIQDQPFRVLILLLERPGEIVRREELRQKLWPEGTFVDFDGSLNVILKKLRAAIDDDSDNPRFIETVPRRGYRFIAPVSADRKPEPMAVATPDVATIRSATAMPGEIEPPPEPAAARAVPTTRNRLFIYWIYWLPGTAVVLLMIFALVGWHYYRSSSSSRVAAIQVRKSIAVLGFHSLSGRAEDAWLATALS